MTHEPTPHNKPGHHSLLLHMKSIMKPTPRSRPLNGLTGKGRALRAFTLMEVMVAAAIVGIGTVVALPQFRGLVESTQITGNQAQARNLVTAVSVYRVRSGNAIAGTATKPMTVARANIIYAQIASYTANGEAIVDPSFALSPNAKFPTGWGETAPGVFDPVQ